MNDTDQARLDTSDMAEGEDWGEGQTPAAFPEYPANPHNHRYTISMNGQGPMVVVRGNTAEEVNAAWQELEEKATGVVMGNAWSAIKAAAAVANGLGATPVPNGAPAPVQGPPVQQYAPGTGPAFNPQMPGPGLPGTAPAAWQNAGAPAFPQAPQAPQLPQGWYKLNVPFPQKGAFDAIVAQYNIRKGDPGRGGQVSFQKAVKSWFCAPEVVQAFAQFSPVPA